MSAFAVFAPRRFGRLLASDAMNISRDPILIVASMMSLLPGLALWQTQAAIDDAALAGFGVAEFSRYLVPAALLIPALLIGWVTGFLLLEDRDDGPLLALDVTPIGKGGFLAYRVTITALVTAAITFFAMRLMVPQAGWSMTLLLVTLVAANAVMVAAVLPTIARNKVEGLALSKVVNIALIVPLLAIIPSPWRYLGGVIPTYWIGELLQLSGEDYLGAPIVIALALATHIAATIAVFIAFSRPTG